jgi:hypothetical protein
MKSDASRAVLVTARVHDLAQRSPQPESAVSALVIGGFLADIGCSQYSEPSDGQASLGACQANCGCAGSRLIHRKAGTEFFQKYFSAAGPPFAMKYVRRIFRGASFTPA